MLKRKCFILISLAVMVCFLTAAGCSSAKTPSARDLEGKISTLEKENAALKDKNKDLKTENQELKVKVAQTGTREVTVYFMGSTPTSFYLAPEKRKVPVSADPMKAAIEELIKGPYANSGFLPTLPKGSKLLGLRLEGNRAVVDFNEAARQNLNVGSSGEALVIASVVNTLTEFPGVKEVQILIAGKTAETLAGHVDISKPLTRNEKDIKKP